MSQHSNDSMPDESIEVIGPEDLLEDSPPPPEVEKIGEIEEKTGEVEEIEVVESVIEATTASGDTPVVEAAAKVEEVVTPEEGDVAAPATAKVEEVATETPEVKEAPAAVEDDPPLEVLEPASAPTPAPAPAPVPAPAAAPVPPVAQPSPQVLATRPAVTPARPAATLEEEDDEEDDDDIDETLVERLVGLTEMFPQFVRTGTVSLVKNSWSLSLASLGLAKAATWVVFSTATILFMPVMIESERLQLQDAQKAQKNSILLGPGVAQSGAPSLGPPPI